MGLATLVALGTWAVAVVDRLVGRGRPSLTVFGVAARLVVQWCAK